MLKKYIIELPETDSEFDFESIHPYTEPDLNAIRNEAYEKGVQDTKQHWVDAPRSCAYKLGYENGLNDAWEAARTVVKMEWEDKNKIFGKLILLSNIFSDNTAAEAIEKIRQYEQEQEEIKVGDEVAFHHDDGRPDTVVVVTYIGQDGFIDGMDGRGTQYAHKNPKKWTKTGRHFPELVELLRKMREGSMKSLAAMRQYLDTFCTNKTGCSVCPLHTPDFTCGRGYSFLTNNRVSDEEVRRAYATVIAKMKEES